MDSVEITVKKELKDSYLEILKKSIDEEGIYPGPGIFSKKDEEGLSMISFMVSPSEVLLSAVKIIKEQDPSEFLWGLDRFSKSGQGVDEKYKSVFTIFHLKDGEWKTGVFAYNSPEDYSESIDWDNKFWSEIHTDVLKKLKLL